MVGLVTLVTAKAMVVAVGSANLLRILMVKGLIAMLRLLGIDPNRRGRRGVLMLTQAVHALDRGPTKRHAAAANTMQHRADLTLSRRLEEDGVRVPVIPERIVV